MGCQDNGALAMQFTKFIEAIITKLSDSALPFR